MQSNHMVGVEQGGCLSNKLIADGIQRIAWQVLEAGDSGGQIEAPHPDQIWESLDRRSYTEEERHASRHQLMIFQPEYQKDTF